MAAKNHQGEDSKKRKRVVVGAKGDDSKKRSRIAGAKGDVGKSNPKKSKLTPNSVDKAFKKKPFNSTLEAKTKMFKKSEKVENAPKTKREARLQAKELAEARKKKRKPHYSLEQELALLWEKMRRRNIGKEDRSKYVSEALKKMKGKIPEIAVSHVSSRVLQACVKYCSQEERNGVFEEIRPHFRTLACNTYAIHLVTKMLETASKEQLAEFISSLHGHVASLLRHPVGSAVVEHAYQLGNATQKQALLVELYSTELRLFKDLVSMKESRLVDIISKLRLQKASVIRHMTSVFQPILEKGIVDHSIIHKALMEFFTIADQAATTDIIQQLSKLELVRMVHTKDGSRIGMLCIKHGSAKERKNIIKGFKKEGHVSKTAYDRFGSMLLVCILSTVDDTKLVTKVIIRELQAVVKEIILDKNGRRPLLQLLHPNCLRYLSPNDLASLDLTIPSLSTKGDKEINSEPEEQTNSSKADEADEEDKSDTEEIAGETRHLSEGGKKDPFLRRQELLVNSGLAESLIIACIENVGELLISNFGKEVLYEVATGGAGGILHPVFDDKLHDLYEIIASLAAKPKLEGSEEEHLFENFHSSRTIRKLVLDCPTFASALWEKALKGKCETWAQGHSCKVVSAFLESSISYVRELAKDELQPLIDGGKLKLPETK